MMRNPMHFNEFAKKRDYDWELQHLGDLNLLPDQLRIAKEKILKAKEAAEYNKAYREANPEKIAARKKKWYQDNKEQIAAKDKKYRENNKEKIAAREKKWREANPEKIAAKNKKYRETHKEQIAAKDKRWRENNPDKVAAQRERFKKANPGKVAAYSKKYYQANKEQIAARQKEYRENNKEKIAAKNKKYRENNPDYFKMYGEANKDKINAQKKKYYQANKEQIAARQKEYRENNKEKIAAYHKKRYQQKKNKNESLIESLQYHIHEVSVNLWKKAAQSSLPGRTWNKEHRFMYRNIDPHKAVDRLRHAEYVAKLPNSNRSANSVKKAADNSLIPRISNQKKQRERAVKAVSLSSAAKGKGINWDEISDIMKKGIRFSKYDRSN